MWVNYYPDIEKAYHLICSFRAWYSPANVDTSSNVVSNDVVVKLEDWFHKVDQSAIAELLNFKSLVQRSTGSILNCFTTRATNAIADLITLKYRAFYTPIWEQGISTSFTLD